MYYFKFSHFIVYTHHNIFFVCGGRKLALWSETTTCIVQGTLFSAKWNQSQLQIRPLTLKPSFLKSLQCLDYNFFNKLFWLFFFGGHIHQCSEVTPCSEFRYHSWKCSGDIWYARNWTQVDWMQGNVPTLCTFVPAWIIIYLFSHQLFGT